MTQINDLNDEITNTHIEVLGALLNLPNVLEWDKYDSMEWSEYQRLILSEKRIKPLLERGFVTQDNAMMPCHYVITEAGEAFFAMVKNKVQADIFRGIGEVLVRSKEPLVIKNPS